MDKNQIVKELIVLIELANMNEDLGLGKRFELQNDELRSKAVKTFLYDLLKVEDDEENENLLRLLKNAIEKNVEGE